MSPPQITSRGLNRRFKSSGLRLTAPVLSPLLSLLRHEGAHYSTALDRIVSDLKLHLVGTSVNIRDLEEAVTRLTRNVNDEQEEGIELINALDSLPSSSSFPDGSGSQLHPEVRKRAAMFQGRYGEVKERVEGNEFFKVDKIGRNASEGGIKLDKIGALLGRASGTSVFLLCHITPSTIEDDTGSATYTLSPSLPPTDGYVTENATVLVEGEIGDGEEGRVGIVIKEIHHPPYANNTETRKAAGNPEQMVVVLSEVKLDRDRVVENLAKVMEGFEGMLESQMSEFSSSMEDDATVSPPPPPVFVMMGSFSSENNIHSKQGPGLYRGGWRRLEKVISQYPLMASKAKFIFVPGSNDPTPSPIPQLPIPNFFTSPLLNSPTVKNVHFASNPCRINFHGKTCVFYNRPGLSQSLSSSSLIPPSPGTGNLQHTFKTILDQSHLSPLPLSSSPIYWDLDPYLRLSPPPSGLILGSSTSAGDGGSAAGGALHYSPEEDKEGTYCVETGRFDLEKGDFVCYYPETGEAEFSAVG